MIQYAATLPLEDATMACPWDFSQIVRMSSSAPPSPPNVITTGFSCQVFKIVIHKPIDDIVEGLHFL